MENSLQLPVVPGFISMMQILVLNFPYLLEILPLSIRLYILRMGAQSRAQDPLVVKYIYGIL